MNFFYISVVEQLQLVKMIKKKKKKSFDKLLLE